MVEIVDHLVKLAEQAEQVVVELELVVVLTLVELQEQQILVAEVELLDLVQVIMLVQQVVKVLLLQDQDRLVEFTLQHVVYVHP